MKIIRWILITCAFIFAIAFYFNIASAENIKIQDTADYKEINNIFQKIYDANAELLDQLISLPTTDPKQVKNIIEQLKNLEKGIKYDYDYDNIKNCIEKVRKGEFVFFTLYPQELWGNRQTPRVEARSIAKDQYANLISNAFFNLGKQSDVDMLDASTEYIKKDATRQLAKADELIRKIKDQQIYYLNQLEKLTQSAQPSQAVSASPVWALETIIDPQKKLGSADDQGDIWTMQSASSFSAVNRQFASTKKSITFSAPLPSETKGNEWFKFTVNVACDTTDQSSCQVYPQIVRSNCLVLRPIDTPETSQMNFFVRAYGENGKPAQNSTTFIAYIDEGCSKSCSGPGSGCDPLPSVSIVNSARPSDWIVVKYVYKKKEVSQQQPIKQSLMTVDVSSITANLPMPNVELDTDRLGMDYENFELPQANPEVCRNACAMDTKCKAYTYVRPGIQGPNARCCLKTGVPPSSKNNCCVSGVKP